MAGVLESLDYTAVPGTNHSHELKLYALSTCAFCRKAMKFLQDAGHEFHYIYLDMIDIELKREAKRELKEKYAHLPVFPILTIDGIDAMSGFAEEKWKTRLDTQ